MPERYFTMNCKLLCSLAALNVPALLAAIEFHEYKICCSYVQVCSGIESYSIRFLTTSGDRWEAARGRVF